MAAADVVTPDELAAVWPGGSDNPLPSPASWWYCWGTFIAFARRMEQQRRRETADVDLRAAIARRSARASEQVTLTDGSVRSVHPKSYWALRFLDLLDRDYRQAAEQALASLEEGSPADVAVHAVAPLAEALCVRVWAWVLTTPGPELPFADDARNLHPPKWTARMTPHDIVAIARAHQRIHADDARIIAEAFPDEGGASRLGLEGFLNTYVESGGHTNYQVFRQFTLGETFANAVSRAIASKEARAAAETKRPPAEI